MATVSIPFATALREAGGAAAPHSAIAGLRHALRAALLHGQAELARPRSGYPEPVVVVVAADPVRRRLLAVLPLDAAFRADPHRVPARAQSLAAAAVAALVDLADATGPPAMATGPLELRVSELDGFLVLARPSLPIGAADLEALAPLALEGRVARLDRLRAEGAVIPQALVEDATEPREPVGDGHPLAIAEMVTRRGGDPADPAAVDAYEEELLASRPNLMRPHADPDPARRMARRMLQRLDGFGKWGGYHTEFAHLTRGFAGNDKALATQVAEALIDAGLLQEKPSVGQRHVYLNPRRVADIRALIETGALPPALVLPPSRRAT